MRLSRFAASAIVLSVIASTGIAAERTILCEGELEFRENGAVIKKHPQLYKIALDDVTGRVLDPEAIFGVCQSKMREMKVSCSCVTTESDIKCKSPMEYRSDVASFTIDQRLRIDRVTGLGEFNHLASDGNGKVTLGRGDFRCRPYSKSDRAF